MEINNQINNHNISIIGHVDAGKTTLTRMLSTVASTASFDRAPESQSRGMTLDLGFSSFTYDVPYGERKQFTIVDCPGHTNLIRQVMSAASIVDSVILVVSAVSSVQLQTVECCVIGDAVLEKRKKQPKDKRGTGVIVVTKVDLIQGGVTGEKYASVISDIKSLTLHTNFENCPILPCSISPSSSSSSFHNSILSSINLSCGVPVRPPPSSSPFYFQIDHCFPSKGVGTILTGTVLSGSLKVNETIELPTLGKSYKVKGIQSFSSNVLSIKVGDRAGICVTGLDSSNLERTVAVTPKSLKSIRGCVGKVKRVRMFKYGLKSGTKFHMSLGNETVMGEVTFFGGKEIHEEGLTVENVLDRDYVVQEGYVDCWEERFVDTVDPMRYKTTEIEEQYCYIKFDRSIYVPRKCQVIGSR